MSEDGERLTCRVELRKPMYFPACSSITAISVVPGMTTVVSSSSRTQRGIEMRVEKSVSLSLSHSLTLSHSLSLTHSLTYLRRRGRRREHQRVVVDAVVHDVACAARHQPPAVAIAIAAVAVHPLRNECAKE